MTRKLAAMLTLLAMAVFFGTWLIRRAWELPTMMMNDFFGIALAIFFISLLVVGPFIAKLGISLVQEVVAERRSREEERRYRARQRYEQVLDESEQENAGEGEAPGSEAPPGI